MDEDALIKYRMGLAYNWTMDGGRALLSEINIRVWVDAGESWVVVGHKDADLLSHEQGHYDIAGLVFRKMGRDLSALRAGTGEDLEIQVASIRDGAIARTQQLNNLYDNDTDHGVITARQQAWDNLIRDCIRNNTLLTGAPP